MSGEMSKPHSHPSLYCYDKHKCRCDECVKLHLVNNELRARRARDKRRASGVQPRRSSPTPLDPEQLKQLRRAVGLPEEGTGE